MLGLDRLGCRLQGVSQRASHSSGFSAGIEALGRQLRSGAVLGLPPSMMSVPRTCHVRGDR